MNSFTVFFVAAMAACVAAEAGYNYAAPAASNGGFSFTSGGGGGGGSSSGWQQVAISGGSNEGQQVDGELLNILRQVLLSDASSGSSSGSSQSFASVASSPSFGYPAAISAPSASYGTPTNQIRFEGSNVNVGRVGGGRVIGIDIGQPQPARQVAEYVSHSSSGGSNFGSFGQQTISRPSSTYGVA